MPVTVTSVERSSSKLIKTYLRSMFSQERLKNLAMLYTENDIVEITDLENIFRDFANKNA